MRLANRKEKLGPAWNKFQKALPVKLSPIRNDEQYELIVKFMNELIDFVGDNETHELVDLLELVGQLVSDYEEKRVQIPDASPQDVLRFLMQQNNLKQTDLAEELGGQPVVSDILKGKRELNVRQVKLLATRFGVSPAVFL